MFDILAVFCELSERFCQYAFVETSRGSLDLIVKNWWILEKLILPKICNFWLKFEFQLSKYQVLELTGEHFSSSEHIYWQHMGILLSFHGSGQRLMHWLRYISITSKTLRLISQFENLPKKHIIPLFAHFYAHLNKNQCLSPTLGVCLYMRGLELVMWYEGQWES